MPIPNNNQSISFSQLKSEYAVTGTSCSYSQLKRGGSFVDNTKNITITDGISGDPTYSGAGDAASNGQSEGYDQSMNHGNLNDWTFSNTTYQNFYGGRYPKQHGFHVNGASASSDLLSLDASNGGGTRAGQYGYYVNLGAVGSYSVSDYNAVLHFQATCDNGKTFYHTVECTIGRAGDYYIWGESTDTSHYSLNSMLQVEKDTGSGYSTVLSYTNLTSNGTGIGWNKLYDATSLSVGDKLKLTLTSTGNTQGYSCTISTSSQTHLSRAMSVLINQNVPTNATLAASNGISLSDFYGGENA